jgi:signal transduction histidine kinase
MSEIAAFVAHEINTPLTNIALLSASVARSAKDPMVLEKLAKLDSQRRLAASIVADIVSLTRTQDVHRVPVDLRGVLDAAFEQTASLVKPGVQLVKELPKDPLIARVDPLRMHQALVNLLRNAYQATGTGSVTVRVGSSGDHITIAIIDTGSGIDRDLQRRIFEPFVTTKLRSEGLGLGLVFAKQLIEAHEGRIEVVSEVGHGSTFTVILPAEREENRREAPPPPAPVEVPKVP